MKTLRLTMAQALIRFMANQYISLDDVEHRFLHGVFGIFGHGNVTGIGEALENQPCGLTFYRGNNEQGMVHAATAFAKQKNRLGIFACTSSIGPGATNMITGAAVATTNRIPVLLLPGDIFACRQPDPVLQQLEVPSDYTLSVNDCFKPVSKYWDRITRPEQLMTACLNAFRVLTDPIDTGAVTLSLPQDVQCESYDYPTAFFEKRIWHLDRRALSDRSAQLAIETISHSKRPLIIVGGGVHYALACDALAEFVNKTKIPVAETQAGKSALSWDHPCAMGGIGVTGTAAANQLAQQADCILAIGTRLQDFTTASKILFQHPTVHLLQLNISPFDAYKMNATALVGDAKLGLEQLTKGLSHYSISKDYQNEIRMRQQQWHFEVDRLYAMPSSHGNSQTQVLGVLNQFISNDDTIVCAAGSLPGDLHRLWQCKTPKDYHVEYAYSCMGYEVSGGFGVALAKDKGEVYVVVGDGSFLMLHSELVTSIQENEKINIILLDNSGFQCIKNLQTSQGSQGFGNELRFRDSKNNQLHGERVPIDFAQYAQSLGAITFYAHTIDDLRDALIATKKATRSTLIEIKVAPNTMSAGYDAWWRVGVPAVSESKDVKDAYHMMQTQIEKTKLY